MSFQYVLLNEDYTERKCSADISSKINQVQQQATELEMKVEERKIKIFYFSQTTVKVSEQDCLSAISGRPKQKREWEFDFFKL